MLGFTDPKFYEHDTESIEQFVADTLIGWKMGVSVIVTSGLSSIGITRWVIVFMVGRKVPDSKLGHYAAKAHPVSGHSVSSLMRTWDFPALLDRGPLLDRRHRVALYNRC